MVESLRDMLASRMRTLFAALLSCLIAGPALAGLKVCNKTGLAAKVALGRFDGTEWGSQGWWTVAPNACAELIGGALDARYYYLYATDGGSGSWDGKNGFCVGEGRTFAIRGRAGCESHGFDSKGFFEVDTGERRDFTQTLAD
jgi:uncharacterized membrane protein